MKAIFLSCQGVKVLSSDTFANKTTDCIRTMSLCKNNENKNSNNIPVGAAAIIGPSTISMEEMEVTTSSCEMLKAATIHAGCCD